MLSDNQSVFEKGQVLLFDKPLYWTSFDLVNKVRGIIRKTLDIKNIKVGHAGTLDPLATGLMIICTGKDTKRIEEFRDLDKEYVATIHLGATTPSLDLETETDMQYSTSHITEVLVCEALRGFIGDQMQMPPLFSAKLIKGKRAYEFARRGIEKELEAVPVNFREIELLSSELPEIKVRLVCSKGTYIRAFARDVGLALKSGGYLSSLQRTAIGPFRLDNALDIEKFREFVQAAKQPGSEQGSLN
jgi:tRNA pseudouridine55 synthase